MSKNLKMESKDISPLNIIYLEKWGTMAGGPISSVSSIIQIIGKEITLVSNKFTIRNGKVENLPKHIKYKTFSKFIFLICC